jgi:hypothetical protein
MNRQGEGSLARSVSAPVLQCALFIIEAALGFVSPIDESGVPHRGE